VLGKLINILIGIVILAVLAVGGLLIWDYRHPENDFVGSKLERDLSEWQAAADETPSDPLVRANLGAIYMDMGDYDKAIEELQTATDLAPEGYSYFERLAVAYRGAGKTDEAIETMKLALEKYPQESKFLPAYELAEMYFEKGEMAAAKDYVNQAIESDDTKWNLRYLRGQILEKEGDLEGAKTEYQYASQFSQDPGLMSALERVNAATTS
jgi:tetratricopeptide (TPR) repeat protein